MPFQYFLPVPRFTEYGSRSKIIFREWLLDLRAPVSAGTAVARIELSGELFDVIANGEGFLCEKLRKPGDRLKKRDNIGMIAAEAENIPYGKPSSLAQAVQKPSRIQLKEKKGQAWARPLKRKEV